MKIYYEEIIIKSKKILESGFLDIPENTITIIKGENGTGKSILFKKFFLNRSLEYKDIVFVDQFSNHIMEDRSISENIMLDNSKISIEKSERLLKGFNVINLFSHKSTELSGGEKRLITILRGISVDADIIIFDEPTNDLDHLMVNNFIDILLNKLVTKTIICITHDDRIINIADKIYEISDKKVNCVKEIGTCLHNSKSQKENKQIKANITLLKVIFSKRWMSCLLMLLMLASTVFSLEYLNNLQNNQVSMMKKNQLDIFTPNATYGPKISKGAIPIGFFRFANGTTSINDAINIYNDSIDDNNKKGLTFGLYTPENIENEIFIIELYNVKTNTGYLVPDIYMNVLYNSSLEIDVLDTTEYFALSMNNILDLEGHVPLEIAFEIQEYSDILNIIRATDFSDNIKNKHIILSIDRKSVV